MSQAWPMSALTSTEVIDQIPIQALDRVTQDFKDSGAVDVKAERNDDGTWRVTATFASPPSA
jgi:hypothetical protein